MSFGKSWPDNHCQQPLSAVASAHVTGVVDSEPQASPQATLESQFGELRLEPRNLLLSIQALLSFSLILFIQPVDIGCIVLVSGNTGLRGRLRNLPINVMV